jgi:hypothetical protein
MISVGLLAAVESASSCARKGAVRQDGSSDGLRVFVLASGRIRLSRFSGTSAYGDKAEVRGTFIALP